MAKYCGKCGSQLNEKTGLCPNCNPAKKKKRHSGAVIAILITLIVLICILIFVLVYFVLSKNSDAKDSRKNLEQITSAVSNENNSEEKTSDVSSPQRIIDTEKRAVLSNQFGDYYNSGSKIIPLEDLDYFEPIKYYDNSSSKENYISFSNYKTAFSEDAFYAQEGDDKKALYKYEFTDKSSLVKSVWVDEKTLNNSIVVPNKKNGYSGNMFYFNREEDYVYFICQPTLEYIAAQKEIAFKLGRISIDGKTIEFLNDEIASAYTVSNGWIYFYDSGYTYDKTVKNEFRIDEDRVGIYKMKCDGSEKQLLKAGFIKDSKNSNNTYNLLCDKMNVYGDYLYYVDYSESGKSKLYRMKLDGNHLECLTQNGVDEYTVDCENMVIYYTDGEFGQNQVDARSLYMVLVDSNKEEQLLDEAVVSDPTISYYDNYIYLTDLTGRYHMGTSKDDTQNVIGMRYDLNDGKTDLFTGYAKTTVQMDSDGFPVSKTSDPIFSFIEDSDTDKLY